MDQQGEEISGSRLKRPIYSSEQTASTLSDAASKTNLDDLRKELPPNKVLVPSRRYLVRKSKRRAVYWQNYLEYLEAILDPHYKMLVVGIALADMFGAQKGKELVEAVEKYAYALFEEYRKMYSSSGSLSGQTNESIHDVMEEDIGSGGGAQYMKSLCDRAKRLKGTNRYAKSEFHRYLNEQLGEDEDMDALAWWGINGHRYPIVSRMARDILAIPLSTVASESAFSAGGRHLDPFRSSLTPKMVQALLCAQDWLRTKGNTGVDLEENIKELEELEKELCGTNFVDDVFYVAE